MIKNQAINQAIDYILEHINDELSDFGYSPSNYSWMFRKQYQTNPVDFRRKSYERALQHPFYHATRGHMETFEECDRFSYS